MSQTVVGPGNYDTNNYDSIGLRLGQETIRPKTQRARVDAMPSPTRYNPRPVSAGPQQSAFPELH